MVVQLPSNTPVKKTVICPECDAEVELKEGSGECPSCGLNVAWVLEKDRRECALQRLRDRREKDKKDAEKKKDGKGSKKDDFIDG
jgi:endogenous inhibitor of DNA gyrase (YacG/DUF329 family)